MKFILLALGYLQGNHTGYENKIIGTININYN